MPMNKADARAKLAREINEANPFETNLSGFMQFRILEALAGLGYEITAPSTRDTPTIRQIWKFIDGGRDPNAEITTAVSVQIRALEQEGYVSAERRAGNRTISRLTMTDAGFELLTQLRRLRAHDNAAFVAAVNRLRIPITY